MKPFIILLIVTILAVLACIQPIIYSTAVEYTKDYETNFEPGIQGTCIMLGFLFGLSAYAILQGYATEVTDKKELKELKEQSTKKYVIRYKPNNIATYYNDQREWTAKITAAKHYHTPKQAQTTIDSQDWAKDYENITVQPIYITTSETETN